jgi:hypothetical protein
VTVTVEQHLAHVSLLSRVSAFLAATAGLALVPLALAALVLRVTGEAPPVAAGLVGVVFLATGAVLLAYAGLAAAIARGLDRRARWSRTLGLVLGLTHLFVPPFGTAYGSYALWVLLRVDATRWNAAETPRPS